MIGVKELDQTLSTKISLDSNLAPDEQWGVGLMFLDNIYVADETLQDIQGSKAG